MSHKIPFEEKDVMADLEARRELVEMLESRATPTLVVGDAVLVGFDADELERVLKIS